MHFRRDRVAITNRSDTEVMSTHRHNACLHLYPNWSMGQRESGQDTRLVRDEDLGPGAEVRLLLHGGALLPVGALSVGLQVAKRFSV